MRLHCHTAVPGRSSGQAIRLGFGAEMVSKEQDLPFWHWHGHCSASLGTAFLAVSEHPHVAGQEDRREDTVGISISPSPS